MKKIVFPECHCEQDIIDAIEKELEYETVVEDEEAAEQFFRDAEYKCEVYHRLIYSSTIHVWNEEQKGEEAFAVTIKEHYTDPGSVDYLYSYSVTPL